MIMIDEDEEGECKSKRLVKMFEISVDDEDD